MLWFTIPLSQHRKNLTMLSQINSAVSKLSFYSLNKLFCFIKVQKDSLPTSSHQDVVYKIFCNNCDATHVGQTGRQFFWSEFLKIGITWKEVLLLISVITNHWLQLNNMIFKWDEVKTLDVQTNYRKHLISEMVNIKRQKNGINLNTDTELFK